MLRTKLVKGLFLSVAVIQFIISPCKAQYWMARRFEATIGAGTTSFFSDIGGYSSGDNMLGFKDLFHVQPRYNYNLSFKYRISKKNTGRISFTGGLLYANDLNGVHSDRGFECLVSVKEPSLIGEFYLIRNKSENSFLFDMGKKNLFKRINRALDLYIFSGAGGIIYSIDGNEKLLAVLKSRNGSAMIFPAGIGTSFLLTPGLDLGIEFSGRYTFSDFVDGYHSAYSSSNDIYYTMNISLIYKIKNLVIRSHSLKLKGEMRIL